MYLELAPMEGITNFIYRNALAKYYGGIDVYFSPFVSAHQNQKLNYKELNDLLPEHNTGLTLIPQILTANAEDFFNTSSQIAELGYDHVNLNFGCPSPTVTTKGKGAGILQEPSKLEQLLDAIFQKSNLRISIKTRIGFSDPSEWSVLLDIYEKFPISELIIHARVREDFYKKVPTPAAFTEAIERFKEKSVKLTYNGNIFSVEDCLKYQDMFIRTSCSDSTACSDSAAYSDSAGIHDNAPTEPSFMLGRGIIANPALGKDIKTMSETGNLTTFKAFNMDLLENYSSFMSGDRNTLFKLKELWSYMGQLFPDNPKLVKSVKKCNSCREYEAIINSIR